ncbi:MAG: hypothetical protein K2Q10_12425 [Rhodospirillales bacterium]|nr:hypothetical protein [Rhodospirillales bacterium]
MRVRLTQLDGKLPSLALMRLAAFHKSRGDEVVFTRNVSRDLLESDYDRVYGSAIFTTSSPAIARFLAAWPGAILGGTGTTSTARVEDFTGGPWERCDYSMYPNFKPSIGFTARGCRLRCAFCSVPVKEGKPKATATVADIWRGEGHHRHPAIPNGLWPATQRTEGVPTLGSDRPIPGGAVGGISRLGAHAPKNLSSA